MIEKEKDNIFGPPLEEISEDSNEKMRQAFTWVCIRLVSLLSSCAIAHVMIDNIFVSIFLLID